MKYNIFLLFLGVLISRVIIVVVSNINVVVGHYQYLNILFCWVLFNVLVYYTTGRKHRRQMRERQLFIFKEFKLSWTIAYRLNEQREIFT